MLTGILLLPVLVTFVYYILKGKKYRWIYIIAKTLPRDIKALVRFSPIIYHLVYWQKCSISIPKAFQALARKNPTKVAIFSEQEKWTFQELEDYSNKVANYFKGRGLKKGDTVALLLENRAEYVGLWVGLSKIGVVTALINTNLVAHSLVHCITTVNSKTLIYGSAFQQAVSSIREKLEDIKLCEYKTKEIEVLSEAVNLEAELNEQPTSSPEELENINPSDKALYIYTSGTTGLPKAAVISHMKYMFSAAAFQAAVAAKDNDILYNPLPLYHSAGGMLGMGLCVICGTSVVIKRKFSASAFWLDCKKYHCTVAQYIGEICRFLLVAYKPGTAIDHPVKTMAGNGLRPELWKTFRDTFKIEHIYEFYGSTEGNVNLVNIDETESAVGFIPRYFSWMYPAILVKCNQDTGEPIKNKHGYLTRCEPDEPGLLIGRIRKKVVVNEFSGYANEKESKKKIILDAFEKGDMYFNSGDILVQDEFGYFYFRDRTGDTFRWKGENVATSEIEAVISKIVGLNDEIIVYGIEVPGAEGKAGMAAIFDPNNQLDIENLGKDLKSNLPAYAIPIFLRVLESIPMTGTFKVKKVDLKKEGYNINVVKDNLYFYDAKTAKYISLTSQLYEEILCGRIRV